MDLDFDLARQQRLLVVVLLAIFLVGLVDIVEDGQELVWSTHFFIDLALILLAFSTAVYLWRNLVRAQGSLRQVREALSRRSSERDAWRSRAQKLLLGLGEAIDEQLRGWELTPTERETALFLLKGFSHREIAEITGRSERTVRQHAVAVYRKSGLSGRAELSAFFLEDLLSPAMVAAEQDSGQRKEALGGAAAAS